MKKKLRRCIRKLTAKKKNYISKVRAGVHYPYSVINIIGRLLYVRIYRPGTGYTSDYYSRDINRGLRVWPSTICARSYRNKLKFRSITITFTVNSDGSSASSDAAAGPYTGARTRWRFARLTFAQYSFRGRRRRIYQKIHSTPGFRRDPTGSVRLSVQNQRVFSFYKKKKRKKKH